MGVLVGGQSNAGAAPGFMIIKRGRPRYAAVKKQPTGWIRQREGVVGGGLRKSEIKHPVASEITYLAQNKPNCSLSEVKTPAPACLLRESRWKKRRFRRLSGIAAPVYEYIRVRIGTLR